MDRKQYIEVPVSLSNNTKDTLYYLTMTCSWQDFYYVDNPDLMIEGVACDKNIYDKIALAPGESKTVILNLTVKNQNSKFPNRFKIGHDLQIIDNKFEWVKRCKEIRKNKNVIWSNAISY